MAGELKLYTGQFTVDTRGWTDIIDITDRVGQEVAKSQIREGQCSVFARGSTVAVTTIEYEPGLVEHDFKQVLEQIAPYHRPWNHHNTWGDNNGAAHLRASLIGQWATIPIVNGTLQLGTWQQLVLVDFDTRARRRTVIVQVIGVR